MLLRYGLKISLLLLVTSSCREMDAVPSSRVGGNCKNATASSQNSTTPLSLTQVTYTEVQPIVAAKCATCHSASSSSARTPYLDTYEGLKANYSSSVSKVAMGSMPPSGREKLTSAEQTTLIAWAQGGYLHNSTSTPTTPTSSTPTTATISYTSNIKSILTTSCVSCHSPSGGKSPDLSTYATAKASAAAALSSMQSGRMPRNGAAVSASNQELFKEWISAGMPETSTATTPTTGGSNTPSTPSSSDSTSGGC